MTPAPAAAPPPAMPAATAAGSKADIALSTERNRIARKVSSSRNPPIIQATTIPRISMILDRCRIRKASSVGGSRTRYVAMQSASRLQAQTKPRHSSAKAIVAVHGSTPLKPSSDDETLPVARQPASIGRLPPGPRSERPSTIGTRSAPSPARARSVGARNIERSSSRQAKLMSRVLVTYRKIYLHAIANRERARINSPTMIAMLSAFQARPLANAAA
jgi:hypothetical protein